MQAPASSALALAERAVGTPASTELLARRPGGPAVWRVRGPGGAAVIKHHAADRAFAQERVALVQMHVDGLTPRLIRLDAQERVLLLEHLEGQPVVAPGDAPTHRLAGAVLHRLHASPAAPDTVDPPMDLGEAIGQRLDGAIDAARQLLHESIIEAASTWRKRARLFVGEPRAACHRDFAPYNWLAAGEQLRIVDFEHARPDHWLVDLVKLQTSAWVEDLSLRGAFLDGYGRRLGPVDEQRLELLCLLHGLVTSTWGHRHGDDELAAHGRQVLERLALVG